MLKESHNFAAEMILKEIGASAGNPTTAGGIDAIGAFGEEMGIRRGQAVDGSGLSRDNQSAPAHQVDWLVKLNGSPTGRLLQDSLQVTCSPPGPGASWLTHRLCGTSAAGKVYGKTGFLSGVRSLAGYTTTANGKRIWFSFNLIDSAGTNQAWAAIDQALVLLTSFSA
jgi:D-alanyl-D-alanine carboxypeptidase/D-alanyl-D-alanine-endopeptidase (penicillin-binding protein 4)